MRGAFNLAPPRATDTAVAERLIQPRERTKGQHYYNTACFLHIRPNVSIWRF